MGSANKKEAMMLKTQVDLIYGKSADLDPNAASVKIMRELREATALVRLARIWRSQVGELGRGMAEFGILETTEALTSSGAFLRKAGREGGRASGQWKNPVLRELELMGYSGEATMLNPVVHRADEFGEDSFNGRAYQTYKLLMGSAKKAMNFISGFQYTQGAMEKAFKKLTWQQTMNMVEGNGKIFSPESLKKMGWDKQYQDELVAWIKKNGTTDTYQGRKVKLMNLEKMPSEMRLKWDIGSDRIVHRAVQIGEHGDYGIFSQTALGRMLFQFRNYGILSFEKQLVADLRSGEFYKPAMALILSSALAAATVYGTTHLDSLTKDNPREYLRERLNPLALSITVANKTGQLASMEMFSQVFNTFVSTGAIDAGAIGSANKYGRSRVTGADIVPGLGMAEDMIKLSRDLSELIINPSNKEAVKSGKQALRTLPLINGPGFKNMAELLLNR